MQRTQPLIYKFHYDYIKTKYGDNSILSFTGTDSLMYEIETEDVYEDFSNDKEMFDFSNYSTNQNIMVIEKNQVVGKLKGETAGVAIEEFVGLKAKDAFIFGR